MKYKFLMVVVMFFTAITNSQATIITGQIYTDDGVLVNLSGLEWLSFEHAGYETIGVSRNKIESESSIWMKDGWRYASEQEVNSLLVSLNLQKGVNDELSNDGVKFFLDNWGRYHMDGYHEVREDYTGYDGVFYGTVTFFNSGYDQIGGLFGDRDSEFTDVIFFHDGYSYSRSSSIDPSWAQETTIQSSVQHYENYNNVDYTFRYFGSLLVRNVSIPEPSTLAIFVLGMIGLASTQFRKQ